MNVQREFIASMCHTTEVGTCFFCLIMGHLWQLGLWNFESLEGHSGEVLHILDMAYNVHNIG